MHNRYDVNKPPGEIICNGPYCEYFRVKKDDPKWLETTLAVDGSVVSRFFSNRSVGVETFLLEGNSFHILVGCTVWLSTQNWKIQLRRRESTPR